MRILLDENVPVDILPVLRSLGIDAESVNFIGWKGLQNGELIVRARQQFNLLLTRDKDFDEESSVITQNRPMVITSKAANG